MPGLRNGCDVITAGDTAESSYIAKQLYKISTPQNIKAKLPGLAGILSRFSAASKLVTCLLVAASTAFACMAFGVKPYTSAMIGWDLFCALMICLSWIIFATAKADQIPHLAWQNDENRVLIFFVVLVIVLVSLFGIILLSKNDDPNMVDSKWNFPFSMLGIALSWFLMHTIFTHHYAHLFYGDDAENPGENKGGLEFPGDEDPDYLDLAYFSFVVGMTFQVSDVQITGKILRRLVLLHGIIAFIFNTIIVALTINVIANLNQS